jgi:hypothetical protein
MLELEVERPGAAIVAPLEAPVDFGPKLGIGQPAQLPMSAHDPLEIIFPSKIALPHPMGFPGGT